MSDRRYALLGHSHTSGGAPEVNDLTDVVTWDDVPDANITESSVIQHNAAILDNITNTNLVDKTAVENITSAQWEFSGAVLQKTGGTFYIADAGNTDYVAMTHNGADFLMTGTNTTSLSILGMSLVTPEFTSQSSLISSTYTIGITSNLGTGRLATSAASKLNSIHGFYDDDALEISTGSSAAYKAGIVLAGRSSDASTNEGINLQVRGAEVMHIGDATVAITGAISGTSTLTLEHATADVAIYLKADTSNTDENANPFIRFEQDANAVPTIIGSVGAGGVDAQGTTFTGMTDNGFAIHCNYSLGSVALGVNGAVGLKVDSNNDTDIAGDLTATSYGGITEANLLDKTANESIGVDWEFTSGLSVLGSVSDIGQVGQFTFLDINGSEGRVGSYNWDTAGWEPMTVVGGSYVNIKPNASTVGAFTSAGLDVTGALTATLGLVVTSSNNNAPATAYSSLSKDMLHIDGKEVIDGNDTWLRLNQNLDFASGIYTPGAMNVAGALDVGGAVDIIGTATIANAQYLRWDNATGTPTNMAVFWSDNIYYNGNASYGHIVRGTYVNLQGAVAMNSTLAVTGVTTFNAYTNHLNNAPAYFRDVDNTYRTGMMMTTADHLRVGDTSSPMDLVATTFTFNSSIQIDGSFTSRTTASAALELHGTTASFIDMSLDGTGGTDFGVRMRYYSDYLRVEGADFKVAQDLYANTDIICSGTILTTGGENDFQAANQQLRLTDTDDASYHQFSSSAGLLAVRTSSVSANHFFTNATGMGFGIIPAHALHLVGNAEISGNVSAGVHDVHAANGNGVRFWGGSTAYSHHMSQATDGTWGGRCVDETSSDYNQYLRMASGTNRGIVFQGGGSTEIMGLHPDGIYCDAPLRPAAGFLIKESSAAIADIAAYGQLWIKDTSPNELWYTDDTGLDTRLTISGDSSALHKFKGADTSRSNNTILDDPDLSGWSLGAAQTYKFTGYLSVTCASSTPDIKFQWQTSAAHVTDHMVYQVVNTSGTVTGTQTTSTNVRTLAIVASNDHGIWISGYIKTHASSSPTVDLRWAQSTTNANAITVQEGSWITFEQLL